MTKQRFTFDDTVEYDKDNLQPNNNLHASVTNVKDVIDNDEFNLNDNGEKPVTTKKKSKFKLKKWQIALIIILSIMIVGLIYIFVASGSNGPVYGERCAKLVTVDTNKFKDVESQVEGNEKVSSLSIEKDCRIIKMTFEFADNTTTEEAVTIATEALHTLDDSLGQAKDDGAQWSQLLNKANGRTQYDIDLLLKSNGDTNFPIFGTKHATNDNISFTGANVKDQATTDAVNQRKAEVDAANAAAAGQ